MPEELSFADMYSEFITYLRLGLAHIADLQGYDHIVFVVALTAGLSATEWRRVLWLVTAFTVAHSLTLALATLDLVRVPSGPVEALIAATIAATGIRGLIVQRADPEGQRTKGSLSVSWAIAAVFGLIHGLGFSSFLRSLLGSEERLAIPLLGFNVGLEVGQLAIVAAAMAASEVARRLSVPRRWWAVGVSLAATIIGLQMLVARLTA